MNKPHKHAELIKAWADGCEAEYRTNTTSAWRVAKNPDWSVDCEWRIKPHPKADIVFVQNYMVDAQGVERRLEQRYSGETGELISSRVLL